MVTLLAQSIMNALLADDTPQANGNTGETGEESEVIGRTVASQTVRAFAVAVFSPDRVSVVNSTIYKVEDVAAKHRGQSHEAPVLRKAANTKGMRGQGWENTEQETVCNTRET